MKQSVSIARPVWLAAAVSVIASHACIAQAQVPPFELQPVIVTGNITPRTLGSEIAATSVLTRSDIERSGARDLVQVLNLLGTALVEQQGGSGALSAVRIRGGESRDTLVLVDGVPTTDLTSGQSLIQHVPADIIERVEVVRGNLAALYGANATGGVIQVFTRRGATGMAPQATLRAGSFDTRAASASLGFGGESIRGRVAAGVDRTRGFSASNAAAANPDDDGYRRKHATLALDADVASGHRLGLDLRYLDAQTLYDSTFGTTADTHVDDTVQTGLTLRGTHPLTAQWSLGWRAGHAEDKKTQTEVSAFGGVRSAHNRNQLLALELGGTITQGLTTQLAVERLEQSTTSESHTSRERDTNVFRAGANYEADWGSLQANIRHDDLSDRGSATTGLLGGRYKLGPNLSVTGSVASSFTPPTFDFLYFFCCSNPNLRPEKARTVDAGLQWQTASTLLRATLFGARYTDKIQNDASFTPQNIGRASNKGLELSARHAAGPWILLAEAVFQDPKDKDSGTRLLRRARDQFALRADWQQAAWQVGAGLRYIGDRLDVGSRTMPSYAVLDASASWAVTPEWRVWARVDNLFDREYQPTFGYNGRPRGVFVSATWTPKL